MIDWLKFHDFFRGYGSTTMLEVISLFETEYTFRMISLKNEIATNDFDGIERDARNLRDMVLPFMDVDARDCAYKLKTTGQYRKLENLPAAFENLQRAGDSLLAELQQYGKTISCPK